MKELVDSQLIQYATLLEHLFGVPCELVLIEDQALVFDEYHREKSAAAQHIDWEALCQRTRRITTVNENETVWITPVALGSSEEPFWLQLTLKNGRKNYSEEPLKLALLDIAECLVNEHNSQLSISGMSNELARCYEEINMLYGLDDVWRNSIKLHENEVFEKILTNSLDHMTIDIAAFLIPDNDLCMHFSNTHSDNESEALLKIIQDNLFPVIRASSETLVLNSNKIKEITFNKVDIPYRLIISGVTCSNEANSGMVVFAKKNESLEYTNSDRKICALMSREISKIFTAKRDPVTGLLNRESFEVRLHELVKEKNDDHRHALIYFDIDRFQIVNDNWGHIEGDRLLKQVGALISSKLDENVIISRLGGDEFGVLLIDTSGDKAEKVAEDLRRAIQELYFVSHQQVFEVSGSFGVAEINSDMTDMVDALSAADLACHLVKETGKNGVRRYQPSDLEMVQHYDQMYWASRIKNSLEENKFELYGQQILPLSKNSSENMHYEILVRLRDDNGKLVSPGSFIPAAERYNLMPLLDRWVLDETLSILNKHNNNSEHDDLISVSINVSGQSLVNDEFLTYAKSTIAGSGIDPKRISLEITETAAVANFDQALKFIHQLHEVGCFFSLDDFGSGMSSFGYLKHLPVDYLKIDGIFIRDIADEPLDRVMVESIHTVAQAMGLKTVAEFVEDERCMNVIKEIGIDYGQGYGIDKPAPFLEKLNIPDTTII